MVFSLPRNLRSWVCVIHDEYDEEVREEIRLEGKSYILDGMLAVRDANKHFGLALAEDGHLLSRAGCLLRPGDRVEDERGVYSVERVENRRISRIRLRLRGLQSAD